MKTSINTNLAAAILSGATDPEYTTPEPVKVYKITAPVDTTWNDWTKYFRHISPRYYNPRKVSQNKRRKLKRL